MKEIDYVKTASFLNVKEHLIIAAFYFLSLTLVLAAVFILLKLRKKGEFKIFHYIPFFQMVLIGIFGIILTAEYRKSKDIEKTLTIKEQKNLLKNIRTIKEETNFFVSDSIKSRTYVNNVLDKFYNSKEASDKFEKNLFERMEK